MLDFNGYLLVLQDDIEIDLDEVLDMDDESDRRTYISVSIFINFAFEFAHRLSSSVYLTRLNIHHTVQWTTRITETGITNLTRITNEMTTSSNYLMKYFNGFLAVLLE